MVQDGTYVAMVLMLASHGKGVPLLRMPQAADYPAVD
jgi:hypothetical protein